MNMSITLTGKSANDIFVKACDRILTYGKESAPRGMKIKELNNIVMTLKRPRNNIVNAKERNISIRYLLAEWLWYVKGAQDKSGSDFICKYAPFWNTLRNPDGSLNSNYGHYFFRPMHEVLPTNEKFKPSSSFYCDNSQFDYIVDTLLNDRDSRQAIVNINNVYHKAHPTKDFPCTTAMQFFIRENRLHMTVTMRSTDLVLGYCNDIFQFTLFQYVVLHELNKCLIDKMNGNTDSLIKMGTFTLFTGSLHVYERHFQMIERTVQNPKNILLVPPKALWNTSLDWIYQLTYSEWVRIANCVEPPVDSTYQKYSDIVKEFLKLRN